MGSERKKRAGSSWVFLVLLGVVMGFALFWPELEKVFESEVKECTVFIAYSDGKPASGALIKMVDADGRELATVKANRKGRIDLPDLPWSRLFIESDYHGFPQRAVVRAPVSSWPCFVELEGP